jgi:HD-GYP domain-containing protein (c-di-GMP phosphodiesterase class II)
VPLDFVNSWFAVGPAAVLLLAGEPSPDLHHWPIFAGALAAQFVLDFTSAAAREKIALGFSPREHLRYMGWVWLVDASLAPVALLLAAGAVDHPYAFVLGMPLVGLLAYFARERRGRIDQALELSHAYRGTAFLLGDVVEADDAYTGSHSRHVVDIVLDVADRLGLDAHERRHAEFTALLHDVGKIRIPAEIINKPGALDDDEWALMKTHTIEGEQMLARVGGLLGEVGRLVRSCHERWDGSGYPDGLAGDAIPLVARIVCCCDAYSAMTTDRPYRAARTVGEALEELERCSGTHFDPDVVAALRASVAALH